MQKIFLFCQYLTYDLLRAYAVGVLLFVFDVSTLNFILRAQVFELHWFVSKLFLSQEDSFIFNNYRSFLIPVTYTYLSLF